MRVTRSAVPDEARVFRVDGESVGGGRGGRGEEQGRKQDGQVAGTHCRGPILAAAPRRLGHSGSFQPRRA